MHTRNRWIKVVLWASVVGWAGWRFREYIARHQPQPTATGIRRVQTQVDVAASPEHVFAIIADPRKSFLTSNPITHMQLGSTQAAGVGTIYRWTFRFPLGLTFRFDEIVTAWEEGLKFAYRATSGWKMQATTELHPILDGTRVVFTLVYRLPWPWDRLIPHWLEVVGSRRALSNIKRLAEKPPAAPDAGEAVALFESDVFFAAPPEEVFRVVGDPRSKLAWVPAIRRVEMHGAPSPGLGARYLASSGIGRMEFAFQEEIVDWQPPLRLAYQGTSPWGRFKTTWAIQAAPGGARAHYRMDYWFPGGRIGRWLGRLAAAVVRRPMTARTMARLKKAVEGTKWQPTS